MLREHIGRVLYDAEAGYFSAPEGCVAPVPAGGLPFAGMRDRNEYAAAVRDVYARGAASGHSFTTPSEIFFPHYSRAVARWMVEGLDGDEPLRVIEAGGGNGTFAAGVLDWLLERRPDVYGRCTYDLVDISAVLHARQAERLADHVRAGVARPRHGALAAQLGGWPREERAVIVALEVLDNMPHDRVSVSPRDGAVREWVVRGGAAETRPARDRLVVEYLRHAESFSEEAHGEGPSLIERLLGGLSQGDEPDWYLPTVQLETLEAVARSVPRHRMLLADFDAFAGALPGRNGPLVAPRGGGADYDDVMDAPIGGADIMFPTQFQALCELHARVCGGGVPGQHVKSAEFFARYGREDLPAATLRDGHCPLVDDFRNTSVFVWPALPPHAASAP